MENVNYDIVCSVSQCKHNHAGHNCMLNKIEVGCCCDGNHCTCCQSFADKT